MSGILDEMVDLNLAHVIKQNVSRMNVMENYNNIGIHHATGTVAEIIAVCKWSNCSMLKLMRYQDIQV